jgi:hypothetical protein
MREVKHTRLYYLSASSNEGGHTNPPPVLKNLFFVPEWDFNLSQITDEAENCRAGRGLTRVNLEVEAIWVGRKKRANSDIVICYRIYVLE